jgi:hypothetical protein
MPLRLSATLACVAALAAIVGTATFAGTGPAVPPKVKPHPFATAIYPASATGPVLRRELDAASTVGANMVRFIAYWTHIAPSTPPAAWNPADPNDPNYNWKTLDIEVIDAVQQGFTPYIDVLGAPQWAQASPASDRSSNRPSASDLALFAQALAKRYSGAVPGVPRVRYYQLWDEPNLSIYLKPQLVDRKPVSPGLYRDMANAFASAVHGVDSANVVIAGALAPFRDITPDVLAQNSDWGPLSFMRELLCLSPTLKKTCSSRIAFDVWAMNPYTSGGPTHSAILPNDVSLGNLDEVSAMLAAAEKHHTITAPHGVQSWVTEFSWDSKPPDPKGVPYSYLERWVPEALYTMWKAGVSVVTWYTTQDNPQPNPYQSGFYTYAPDASGTLKPYAQGFRFPFVAYPTTTGAKLWVWGRTPTSRAGAVRIQQKVGSAWRTLATLRAKSGGLFSGTVPRKGNGSARAIFGTPAESSLAFAMKELPDKFFNPFGLSTPLEPKKK